jgi:hypothetical protein
MTCPIAVRRILMVLSLAMIPAAGACDAFSQLFSGLAGITSPAGDPLPTVPSDSVLLVMENRSGEIVSVRATFENRSQAVRETVRVLAASGNESSEELLRTIAERITVVARMADSAAQAAARPAPGDVLAEQEYLLGQDYQAGDTIRFIVPPAFADCNGNLVPDDEDIAAGTTRDCNINGIPDDCDIATGTSSDCNFNGSPDECDIAGGTSRDYGQNGIPDECESGGPVIVACAAAATMPAVDGCEGPVPDLTHDVLIIGGGASPEELTTTQTPSPGTLLSLGIATTVEITVSDPSGRTASCTTTVTLADLTPPAIAAPPMMFIGCGEPLDPALNESLGRATATDNCDSAPAITYSDDVSFYGDCSTTILRWWTATDAAGNSGYAVQLITATDQSPPSLTCPPDVVVQPGEPTDPSATGSASATDVCDPDCTVDYLDDLQETPGGGLVIHRTWTATDRCAQSTSCLQTITVMGVPPAPGRVYWTAVTMESGMIQSARTDGSDLQTHLDGECIPREIDVDPVAGQMFWVNYSPSLGCTLRKAGLDGTGAHTLPLNLLDTQGLAVEPVTRALYWTDRTPTAWPRLEVYRSDLSGDDQTTIASPEHAVSPGAIAVDNSLNLACWTQSWALGYGYHVFASDLNGGSLRQIYTSTFNPLVGVAIAPTSGSPMEERIIYWTEYLGCAGSEIRRANWDGSSVETILTIADDYAWHLAIDGEAGKLYWTLPDAGKIGRSNLDGSSPEDFMSGLGYVGGIAVWHPAP